MSFVCTKCSNAYKHKSSLETHLNKCVRHVSFTCTFVENGKSCGKVFKEKGRRDNHVKEVHLGQKRKSKEATCPECGKVFPNTQKLGDHRDALHLDNKYYCENEGCDFFANTKPKLCYHKRKCYNKLRCETCTRTFASNANLQHHYKSRDKCQPLHRTIKSVPDAVQESPKKRKYDSAAGVFLDKMVNNFKNFVTNSTPLNMDGEKKCYYHHCYKTRLAYGEVGGDNVSCLEHKKPNHKNLSELGLCVYKGCTTRGHVTIDGCLPANFCTRHAQSLVDQGLPEEFVNWTKNGKFCSVDGCEVVASFDNGLHCKTHSSTKVSDDDRICAHEGCTISRPTFGFIGEKKTKCIKHKEDGMYSRKLCGYEGCYIGASYGPRGGVSSRCSKHKQEGDIVESRCSMACCMYSEGIQGKFFHPDHQNKDSEFFGKKICSFARRVLIEVALWNNEKGQVQSLLQHFGLKEVVTLNAQSAFQIECEKHYHGLVKDCVQVVFDKSVIGQAKSLGNRRPDIFYKWEVQGKGFAIHLEYDEKSSHENDVSRLERIAEEAGCKGKTYVIRVRGGHDTKDAVCKPVHEKYYKYYEISGSGGSVCRRVAELVKERIGWIHEGLAPNSERDGSIVV